MTTTTLYILKRYNSQYTYKDFLLGVFRTENLAAVARQTYINKRRLADPFQDQLYYTVDLDNDVFVETIEHVEIQENKAVIWAYHCSFMGMEIEHNSGISTDKKYLDSPFEPYVYSIEYELDKLYDEVDLPTRAVDVEE